jgi:hypothetical protein
VAARPPLNLGVGLAPYLEVVGGGSAPPPTTWGRPCGLPRPLGVAARPPLNLGVGLAPPLEVAGGGSAPSPTTWRRPRGLPRPLGVAAALLLFLFFFNFNFNFVFSFKKKNYLFFNYIIIISHNFSQYQSLYTTFQTSNHFLPLKIIFSNLKIQHLNTTFCLEIRN